MMAWACEYGFDTQAIQFFTDLFGLDLPWVSL